MFSIFKNQRCTLCKKKYEKKTGVKCNNKNFCSAKCAVGHLLDLTPEELPHIDFTMFNSGKNIYGITVKGGNLSGRK